MYIAHRPFAPCGEKPVLVLFCGVSSALGTQLLVELRAPFQVESQTLADSLVAVRVGDRRPARAFVFHCQTSLAR